MMLVISVIVAVAILGILLGFLKIVPDVGVNAKEVMPDLMKKVNQRGYGMEINKKVMFEQGNRFYRLDAIGESPISEDAVKFVCDGAVCSAQTSPLTITETSIVVNDKITATVAVCLGKDQNYKIVVGDVPEEVSSKAEQECSLT